MKGDRSLAYSLLHKGMLTVIWLLMILILTGQALAGWKTVETDNFYFHFPQELEKPARQVMEIAEDVHRELIQYYDYQKPDKTHLVIKDDSDLGGGYADPHLLDQIVISLGPSLGREFGTDYECWLRLLIAHEYSHILHLNIRDGGSDGIRRTLGKIPMLTTPNMLQPWWMIEGYAIIGETKLTEGGRAEDSIYDMYLRTAFLEDSLYYFDQIHGQYDLDSWPTGGKSVYIYGAAFFNYLVEEYGMDDLLEVSRVYSRRPTSSVNTAFEQVYGRDAFSLFEEWKADRYTHYLGQKEKISQEELTEAERLTEHGYETYSPVLDPEGKRIVYYHTGNMFPGLREYSLDEEEDNFLRQGYYAPTGHSFSPDGKELLYSRADYRESDNLYLQLYSYSEREDRELPLREGKRARDPVKTPEGGLFYIAMEKGESKLIYRSPAGEEEALLQLEEGMQYYYPRLSPDGDQLALIIWRPGGYQDLYLYSLEEERLTALTQNRDTVTAPAWSPDGRFIIFSADPEGIYNLYAYELEERTFYQVTNMITGAFDPVVVPNKGLVFVGYSSEGYDLYRMPYQPEEWKEYEFEQEARLEVFEQGKEPEDPLSISSYNPLLYAAPKYMIPSLYLSTHRHYVGVTLGGRDPLDTYQYELTLEYEGDDYPLFYNWQLGLDAGPLLINQQSIRESGAKMRRSDLEWVENHRLQAIYPLYQSLFMQVRLGGGVIYRQERSVHDSINEDYRGYLFLNYGTVSGRDYFIHNRDLLLQLNLDYQQQDYYSSLILDWRERFSFEDNGDIALRGAVGLGEDDSAFRVGGVSGNFPLRGYHRSETGSKLYYFQSEYRNTLKNFKRGQGLAPVFYDHLSGALFVEGAMLNEEQSILSYGGELSFKIDFMYGLAPMRINLGLATNSEEEGMNFYLSQGISF